MHKCKSSECAVRVSLISTSNFWRRVEKCSWAFFILLLPATRVYFVIKLAWATEQQVGLAIVLNEKIYVWYGCGLPIEHFHVTFHGGARDQTCGAGTWCTVEPRFSTLRDVHAKCTWILVTEGLTLYVQYHFMCTTAYLLVHHDSHHMHKTVTCQGHW